MTGRGNCAKNLTYGSIKLLFVAVAVALIIASTVFVLNTSSDDSEAEWTTLDTIKWNIAGDGVLTIESSSESSVIMPDYGYHEAPWYSQQSLIKSVVIDKNVTTIGKQAFRDLKVLTSVTIPEGVTSIGNGAFYGCKNIELIDIPNGVMTIGDWVFQDCEKLRYIGIPSSVTTMGSDVFYGCKKLESINMPKGVTTIGKNMFVGCTALTSVTIPEGVITIGNSAFSGCTALTSVTIPEGVTTIGDSAFRGCKALTSVTIPEGVTTIENSMFSGCTALTSVTIPEGVITISGWAFQNCASLTSVTIPEGVITIGNSAFSGCTSFKSITIPSSMTTIGNSIFSGCKALTSVTMPEGVTAIGITAFSGCTSLKSITIPSSMTTIGNYAFSGCTSLTTINFEGKAPSSIGSYAFSLGAGTKQVACNVYSKELSDNKFLDKYGGSYTTFTYNEFTVKYDGSGSTSGSVPGNIKCSSGSDFIVSGNTGHLFKTGHTFIGWRMDGSGIIYKAGEKFSMPFGDVTLYAVWTANTYTVKFDSNGGTGSMSGQTFTFDVSQDLFKNSFTKAGYTFTGWNTRQDGTGITYTNGQFATITENTELYAQWIVTEHETSYILIIPVVMIIFLILGLLCVLIRAFKK